jgi:hypothetical protein
MQMDLFVKMWNAVVSINELRHEFTGRMKLPDFFRQTCVQCLKGFVGGLLRTINAPKGCDVAETQRVRERATDEYQNV